MTLLDPLIALARLDSIVGLPFVALIAGIALWRRQRPLTFNRLVEVGLPATLLVMMAIRYAMLAPFVAAFPERILGAGVGAGVWVAGVFVAMSIIGFYTWHGTVLRKLIAATLLLAVAVGEVLLNVTAFAPREIALIDGYVGLAVAAVTMVMAIFNWAHRSATPSPLGGAHEPPLDY